MPVLEYGSFLEGEYSMAAQFSSFVTPACVTIKISSLLWTGKSSAGWPLPPPVFFFFFLLQLSSSGSSPAFQFLVLSKKSANTTKEKVPLVIQLTFESRSYFQDLKTSSLFCFCSSLMALQILFSVLSSLPSCFQQEYWTTMNYSTLCTTGCVM